MFQVTVKEIGGENVDVYICAKAGFDIPGASKSEDYMDVLDKLLINPESKSVINMTGVTNMGTMDIRDSRNAKDIRDQLVLKAEELKNTLTEIYSLIDSITVQEVAKDIPNA